MTIKYDDGDIAACKAAVLLSTIKDDAINYDNPLSVVRQGVASAPDDVLVKFPFQFSGQVRFPFQCNDSFK